MFRWIGFFIVLLLLPLHQSTAQIPAEFSTFAPDITLRPFPAYPEPGDEVIIRLESDNVSVSGADITWVQNDEELPFLQNQTIYRFIMGENPVNVAVRVVTANQVGFGDAVTVTPSRIDMMVEGSTSVPPFYLGRALPSPGSLITVTAIPVTSENVNPSNYTYNWQINDNPVQQDSGRGRNVLRFTPGLDNRANVKVTISNQNGSVIGEDSISISLADPEIIFYEVNPLRGLNPIALTSPYIMSGAEMDLRAEPYYFNLGLGTGDVKATWLLNGRTVNESATDPLALTIRRQGDQGQFSIDFRLHNRISFMQKAESRIQLRY